VVDESFLLCHRFRSLVGSFKSHYGLSEGFAVESRKLSVPYWDVGLLNKGSRTVAQWEFKKFTVLLEGYGSRLKGGGLPVGYGGFLRLWFHFEAKFTATITYFTVTLHNCPLSPPVQGRERLVLRGVTRERERKKGKGREKEGKRKGKGRKRDGNIMLTIYIYMKNITYCDIT
jgi:hypothetical protein